MILSMTGFGKAEATFKNGKLICEVKSLNNNRGIDVRLKLPALFKAHELAIRQRVQTSAIRGKLDVSISLIGEDDGAYEIDHAIFKKYHASLSQLTAELGVSQGDIIQTIMRIPNVLNTAEIELTEYDKSTIDELIEAALNKLYAFRLDEGSSMEVDLIERVNCIQNLLNDISQYETQRDTYFRDRLWKLLVDKVKNDEIDKNRFEQEVLYYLDKLDISEEKVRLTQHCNYFTKQVQEEAIENGRKLNFISQEMGREINTLGSKAQDSNIQHLVVRMKEELEKIKEQIANIV